MLSRFIAVIGLVGLLSACVTHETTGLTLSGTPRASFTVLYRIGAMDGTVRSNLGDTGAPSQVLEGIGRDFSCDIAKGDSNATLVAEVIQHRKAVFRAEAAAGTQGVKISRANGRWQQETY